MKVIDVDFSKKKINFTFDTISPLKRKSMIEQMQLELAEVLDVVKRLDDDPEYYRYCSKTFAAIIYKLQGENHGRSS